MRRIAVDIEHALALQLKVTLADDASLLAASSGIGERVLCVLLYAEADALAVLDVERRSRRIGERNAAQLYGSLVRTLHSELAVIRTSRERIGDLAARLVADRIVLRDAHVRSAYGGRHILCHVASHGHRSRRTVVRDAHGVVLHLRIVNVHASDVADVYGLSHYGQR